MDYCKEIKENDILEQYEKNITEFERKNIQSVFKPSSLEELQEIVQKANDNNDKLFVVSTGKNWGLGSKQPVEEGNSVVHLQNMNKIIEVNERFNYAIIEPGVTQKDLSDYILKNHPSLKFPVTGSSTQTSVIGNILERGAAGFGHRNYMVVAMEVLLGNGELLKTGLWHYFEDNNPLAFHYPFGHGPDLRGLFTQSNMGIVTKMVIRLQPRLEGVIAIMKFEEDQLKDVTNLLQKNHEEKIIDDGIVITNENDPRTTQNRQYGYEGKWIAMASFSGEKKLIGTKMKLFRRIKKKVNVELIFVSSKRNKLKLKGDYLKVAILDKIKSSSWLSKKSFVSKPTKSGETLEDIIQKIGSIRHYFAGTPLDYSIQTMAEMNNTKLLGDELDNSAILGLSVALPAVPVEGDAVLEVTKIVNAVSERLDVLPFHNFASVDDLTFEGFYRIYFDRTDKKEVEVAHQWSKELHDELRVRGYYPYRIDNKNMQHFVDKKDPFWRNIKKIKLALDENEIISRKKYNY